MTDSIPSSIDTIMSSASSSFSTLSFDGGATVVSIVILLVSLFLVVNFILWLFMPIMLMVQHSRRKRSIERLELKIVELMGAK